MFKSLILSDLTRNLVIGFVVGAAGFVVSQPAAALIF